MNFKILFILFLMTSCGVKSDLIVPPGTNIPNYPDEYLQTEESTDKAKKNKKEKP